MTICTCENIFKSLNNLCAQWIWKDLEYQYKLLRGIQFSYLCFYDTVCLICGCLDAKSSVRKEKQNDRVPLGGDNKFYASEGKLPALETWRPGLYHSSATTQLPPDPGPSRASILIIRLLNGHRSGADWVCWVNKQEWEEWHWRGRLQGQEKRAVYKLHAYTC